jgi:RNA polymerase sigma factor (sigma-70 family)
LEKSLKNLVLLCKDKDRKAQESLYSMYSPILFSICLRYAENYEDAQDIFQEGFVIIFNKIDQYKFEGSFEGWMKRIMVNLALSKFRKKNLTYEIDSEKISEPIQDEEENLMDFEYDELLRIIQELPPQYKQVFNLYVFEEYKHPEIATLLNISVNTSKSNLSRARNLLKEKISLLKKPVNHE